LIFPNLAITLGGALYFILGKTTKRGQNGEVFVRTPLGPFPATTPKEAVAIIGAKMTMLVWNLLNAMIDAKEKTA
jgi:hypothetical protein